MVLFPFSTDYDDGTENNKATVYESSVKPVIGSLVWGRRLASSTYQDAQHCLSPPTGILKPASLHLMFDAWITCLTFIQTLFDCSSLIPPSVPRFFGHYGQLQYLSTTDRPVESNLQPMKKLQDFIEVPSVSRPIYLTLFWGWEEKMVKERET